MSIQIVVEAPREVRLRKAKRKLEIRWSDGELSTFSCLALRKSCACASCVRDRQVGTLTLIDAEVAIDRLEVSGISGLQFHFSDGHYRGLYPWAYLRELASLTTSPGEQAA